MFGIWLCFSVRTLKEQQRVETVFLGHPGDVYYVDLSVASLCIIFINSHSSKDNLRFSWIPALLCLIPYYSNTGVTDNVAALSSGKSSKLGWICPTQRSSNADHIQYQQENLRHIVLVKISINENLIFSGLKSLPEHENNITNLPNWPNLSWPPRSLSWPDRPFNET